MQYKDKIALNKCAWSQDGKLILTGDCKGNVNVYTLNQKVIIFINFIYIFFLM
jgi:hypothetical protein